MTPPLRCLLLTLALLPSAGTLLADPRPADLNADGQAVIEGEDPPATPTPEDTPPRQDPSAASVRFTNNDRLPGSLAGITPARLSWQSPLLKDSADFNIKGLLDITLPAQHPEIPAGHEAVLSLTNGDTLRGQLASVTDETIELDTWFAGRLNVQRVMVSELRVDSIPDLLFRGPSGLDGWKQTTPTPSWTYDAGAFISSGPGGIGRLVDLPDEFRVGFSAEWRGSFRLNFIFFTNDIDSERPGQGYEVMFQRRMVHLRGLSPQNWIDQTHDATALQEDEKARIEILASRKSGQVVFILNGTTIAVWNDPAMIGREMGKGIQFVAFDGSPIRISRIEVSAWDGTIEEMPKPKAMNFPNVQGLRMPRQQSPAAEPEKPQDDGRMMLRNGDSIAGEVLSIREGMLQLKTPFAEVTIPVDRLRNIQLKPTEPEVAKRNKGDVRGWLPDGSSFVFRLDAADQDSLTGFSQNFGTARFLKNAFQRIEFNIHDFDLQELRASSSW